jgi:metal-dependent amidase/aminoacylase/carboxypeptidase family protein
VTGPGPDGGADGADVLGGLAAVLRAAFAEELGEAVALRHELHATAEPSGAEHRTAATVAAALGAADAPPVGGTGRLVRIGPQAGPCVAIRAELDALPIAEQTGAPFASSGGAMHACGHDVHLAALVALSRAARRVAAGAGPPAAVPAEARQAAPALPAALLAVLQPREEVYPSGARDIVESAAFAAQRPAAIVGVHLQPQLPAGTVAAAAGTVNAACDDFEIRVDGAAGHAGYPHLTADPVPALCQVVLGLQQIVSRRADPLHSVVVSVGVLEAGHAPNVIPPTAIARGTLRVLDEADRPAMHKALQEIVEHTSLAHGCRGSVTVDSGEPALVNDEALAEACWPWLRRAGFAVNTSFRSCGSDDFSYYVRHAPTLMLFVGTGGPFGLHDPQFLPSDDAVGQVAAVMLAGYLGAASAVRRRVGPAAEPR